MIEAFNADEISAQVHKTRYRGGGSYGLDQRSAVCLNDFIPD
jgi:hypothetical protein